jgi:hypothetical protein
MLLESVATLARVLEAHASELGGDRVAYRNHACRVSFGLPRARLQAIFARWPNAGFHRRLVHLTLPEARRHPLRPLPVLKW